MWRNKKGETYALWLIVAAAIYCFCVIFVALKKVITNIICSKYVSIYGIMYSLCCWKWWRLSLNRMLILYINKAIRFVSRKLLFWYSGSCYLILVNIAVLDGANVYIQDCACSKWLSVTRNINTVDIYWPSRFHFRPFAENLPTQLWYFFKCIYFGLSAYQIRCHYPSRILSNFLMNTPGYASLTLFLM